MSLRTRLSLDGPWRFWCDPSGGLEPGALDAAAARLIAVPAPWQSQANDLRQYTDVGWYQRTVELRASWQGGRMVVGFGAVDYLAEVWFNDVRIGEHEGGYLPFEFDVTQAACPGLNTITVCVTGPAGLVDPPVDYFGSASAISSPRLWSAPLLLPAGIYSIPDVPATPPSICYDPQPIALPSQPSYLYLFGDKDTPKARVGYDVSKHSRVTI